MDRFDMFKIKFYFVYLHSYELLQRKKMSMPLQTMDGKTFWQI